MTNRFSEKNSSNLRSEFILLSRFLIIGVFLDKYVIANKIRNIMVKFGGGAFSQKMYLFHKIVLQLN